MFPSWPLQTSFCHLKYIMRTGWYCSAVRIYILFFILTSVHLLMPFSIAANVENRCSTFWMTWTDSVKQFPLLSPEHVRQTGNWFEEQKEWWGEPLSLLFVFVRKNIRYDLKNKNMFSYFKELYEQNFKKLERIHFGWIIQLSFYQRFAQFLLAIFCPMYITLRLKCLFKFQQGYGKFIFSCVFLCLHIYGKSV